MKRDKISLNVIILRIREEYGYKIFSSTIGKIYEKWKDTRDVRDLSLSGRPKTLSEAYITLCAKRNPEFEPKK